MVGRFAPHTPPEVLGGLRPLLNLQAAASAADLQNLRNIIINLWFFKFLCSRERANLVRIELASKLPQELYQIIQYRPQTESQTFGKIRFNTFVKNWTSIGVLRETGWRKMSVMTVGSFHVFIKKVTLTCNLQVKLHVSLQKCIFIFSVQTIYFPLRADMWGVYMFRI
jgi:hypothetical protein